MATSCRPRSPATSVYNNANVRGRELATLGSELDKAVTVGANTINGVSFSVADPEQALRRSLQGTPSPTPRARPKLYAGGRR